MKPQGCERHRWVKPRGREERERVSQSAETDNSVKERGSHGALRSQQTTTCHAVLSRRLLANPFGVASAKAEASCKGGSVRRSLVRRRINSCPESYLNVSPPERNFVKRQLR